MRTPPMETTLSRECISSMPLTIKLARRVDGSSVTPSEEVTESQISFSIIVTCRQPPQFALPTMPFLAAKVTCWAASILPPRARFTQIASRRPGVDALLSTAAESVEIFRSSFTFQPYCHRDTRAIHFALGPPATRLASVFATQEHGFRS